MYPQQPYHQPAPGWQPPPRRGNPLVAVAIVVAAVVLLAVAVVAVYLVAAGSADRDRGQPRAAAPAHNSCLIGVWKQTRWQADVDVGALVGRTDLGTVTMSGSGRTWTFYPRGRAMESNILVDHTGRAADGRTVKLSYSGVTTWRLTATATVLNLTGGEGDTTVRVSVDGGPATSTTVPPADRTGVAYTCNADTLEVTGPGPGDVAAFARYS